MIEPDKLFQIKSGQRRRKIALCFGMLERDILGVAEEEKNYKFSSMTKRDYLKKLVEIVIGDSAFPEVARLELEELIKFDDFDMLRVCNIARNNLLKVIGISPAEWDLIVAPHEKDRSRNFYKNLFVYAEDIRSPFNLGSIFRTAEAMGVEKLFLSPLCCDEKHPRAIRSSMGCINLLAYERVGLQELKNILHKNFPIFVLETGGMDVDKFTFPQNGLVIIGSEELGVSPEALKIGNYGTVSIPMSGKKASLNVSVAFGILLQKWVENIR